MTAKSWLLRRAAQIGTSAPLAARLAGRHDDDLDVQVAAILALSLRVGTPPLESLDVARARVVAAESFAALDATRIAMATVVDTAVPGRAGAIPVRIYVPHDAGPDWIVYLHGGGGVIGSIDSYDPVTRLIAANTRCTVASVGYRLGPEARHPAAIEDACDAWDAVVDRVPAGGKIAVAGDSFGGYLAAHVDRHGWSHRRPDLQVLIYPGIAQASPAPSLARLGEGYLLTEPLMTWFRAQYFHDHDDRFLASPASWPDLAAASPAIVATAGFDPLVDEGDDHARRLADHGVAVRHRPHPSLVHGFVQMTGAVRAARRAVDALCVDVTEVLASSRAD